MSTPVLVKSRILVVEDEPPYMDYVRNCLVNVTQDEKEQRGVSGFEVYEAESVEEAERLLKEAEDPFDLVLLDLRLPMRRGEFINLDHGRALLHSIRESKKAKGVVIMSAFHEYNLVIEGFHAGALDYVAKPLDETLSTTILNALSRLLSEESARIINRRVRDLVAYAEVGLVHSFKVVFKNLDDGVTKAADDIERYARERFRLDKDSNPNDSLILQLQAHRKVISKARRDWARLQSELTAGGKDYDVGQLGRMLRVIRDSLRPCLAVKRVSLELTRFDEKSVMTFEKDVEAVLREVVVGALSELPDYGRQSQITVRVSTEDTLAVVRFVDRFEPIPAGKVNAVNERQRVLPDAEFGRAWGLSVAQHVALRGGGSLNVGAEGGENLITYKIPMYTLAETA
jgi:DNA-binding response OmpR family regulator